MNVILRKIAGLVPYDKSLHIVAGFVLFAVGNLFNTTLAVCLVLLVGAGRELYGMWRPQASTAESADLLATLAGGLLGLACAAAGISWVGS